MEVFKLWLELIKVGEGPNKKLQHKSEKGQTDVIIEFKSGLTKGVCNRQRLINCRENNKWQMGQVNNQIVNRACWFDLKEQGPKLQSKRNENRKNTKLQVLFNQNHKGNRKNRSKYHFFYITLNIQGLNFQLFIVFNDKKYNNNNNNNNNNIYSIIYIFINKYVFHTNA